MDLQALIDLTRSLAGDPIFEDNSPAWTEDEVVQALNWAQTRYAEVTHCTYKEVQPTTPSDASGIFTVPAGFITVDRVSIPDQAKAVPVATLTAPTTAPNGTSVSASVPAQTGASYFWSIAGGVITLGQGTNALTFTAMPVPGGMATVSCIVTMNGLSADGQADVSLT